MRPAHDCSRGSAIGDATFVRVRAVFAVVDRWTDWLVERFYDDVYRRVGRRPGAAGSTAGLECCERTSDGWVCRWARARMSPDQLMQLGHDLRSIVGGEDAAVEVHWGQRLRRGYSPEEASKLPIASLRNARLITVSATGTPPGPSARVSISRSEPALEASISGLSDVADDVAEDLAQRANLLWRFVCQVRCTGCPRPGRASGSAEGAAGLTGLRDARSDSYARVGCRRTGFRRESPLSKDRAWPGRVAHS